MKTLVYCPILYANAYNTGQYTSMPPRKISQAVNNESVILLHGLARTSYSMRKLANALQKAGYVTINQGYPSTRYPIEELADHAIPAALAKCQASAKVHFVSHSMGGILVRQYLSKHTLLNLGRIIMLAPPNQGSQLVDKLDKLVIYRLLNGPAGSQMGTDSQSIPNRLGPVNYELGVIAGNRSINWLLSAMLPKPDDGKVSVENTKITGMTDHITLPVTHTFMMRSPLVIYQVQHFLKHGKFEKNRKLRS